MRRSRFLLLALTVGCGPAVEPLQDGSSGESVASTSTVTSSPGSSTSPVPPTTSGTPPDDGSTSEFGTTTGGGTGVGTTSVDTFATGFFDGDCSIPTDSPWFPCERGEECRPWANDGGDAWNGTHCVALSDAPVQVGDACVVEGNPAWGRDNCVEESMCFGADPETLEGSCVAYCQDYENPYCEDPTTTCVRGNEESIAVCLPQCDPLLQDCGDAQTCVGNYTVEGESARFFCMVPGTPYINDAGVRPADCGLGGLGVPTSAIDTCEDEAPCCTTFCDLSEMDTCAEGLMCAPYLPEGKFPGEFNVGVCVSPPPK